LAAMAGSRAEIGQQDVPVSPAVPGAAGRAGKVAAARAVVVHPRVVGPERVDPPSGRRRARVGGPAAAGPAPRHAPLAVTASWLHVLLLSPAPHEDSRDVPGFMLRAGLPGTGIPRCSAVLASAPLA